ncbi:LLM class flavin-dependent oxidoreductase [Alkalicoccobacillus porphyridii]|uniref:LLM class flavin-dependent oxidoreductase n=1 Tax=Alkalicoccobacillus porphyridii TaxID=2597270 RepID=A0A554A2D4_9BACI|nr:LLM class flavin-dependent oxidoreductase [Alkalicoccobacillus porphyridii]TSB47850.1 LLM class flavin-dependent oxidoreductase [Alkalicoccobacillus porphyridii]
MVEFISMFPTSGDSKYVGVRPEREPTFEYNQRIAQIAEKSGISSMLLPTGSPCLDASIVAASLINSTKNLNFLYAARPGFISPSVFAKQFSTLDYLSNGRAQINVVTGGSPVELSRDGDTLPHDQRYKRTAEFVHIIKSLFEEDTVSHEGDFYTLKGASLFPKSIQQPRPEIFIGGASEAGQHVAAEHGDVYMLWGESYEETRNRIQEMKALEKQYKRTLKYSASFQVIVADTEELAWEKARNLLSKVNVEQIQAKSKVTQSNESIGEKRLEKLRQTSKDKDFILGPNVWAGLTQVLGGNSIALVGTPDQIADRVIEYAELGFEKILLRGYPHLETVEAIGRDIIPRVNAKLKNTQAV